MGIAIGNKIELVKLDQIIRNEQKKRVYVSKIYDILPKGKLQIAMPIYEGKIVPLDVDDKYTACFYTERGLFQCNVLVTSRYKSGNLFFIEVLLLGELEKVQRRQFYRHNCMLEARIRAASKEEFEMGAPTNTNLSQGDLHWEPARIMDISGGGVKLFQRQHLEKNQVVKLKFSVNLGNENINFDLFARILASTSIQNRVDMYEQRIEFLKIGSEDRDKIVRFIFESERVARAKGRS